MEIRLTERHIMALNVLLVIILAYFAARSVNDIVAMRLAPEPAPPQVSSFAAQSGATAHPRPYYEGIVQRDIFNLVPEVEAPAPVVAEDLHLKLLGVSTMSGGKPFAIVEDRTGQQALYRVGEQIPSAGKLIEVASDRIIIEHAGRRVAVALPKDELPGPVTGPSGVPVQPAVEGDDNPPDDTGDGGQASADEDFDPNVTDLGENKYAIPRSTIDHSLKNMAELFTEIRAIPNMRNGKTNGFSLSEIAPGSVFDEMGFEEGDLLSTVNGQTVTDPGQAMQMLSQLRNQHSITVQVSRDGKPVTLTYTIQ